MPFLPMFPLKLVVFPEENLNLHIFEPRYQELVDDCLVFGVPLFYKKVREYGTEVNLVEVAKKYLTGESDIKTVGGRRFRILQFYRKVEGKQYGGADIEYLEDVEESDYLLAEEVVSLISELYGVMGLNHEFEQNPSLFKTFRMAHHIGLNMEQEYELLQINMEVERLLYFKQHLQKLIPNLKEVKRLQERIKMNGHFKNLDALDL